MAVGEEARAVSAHAQNCLPNAKESKSRNGKRAIRSPIRSLAHLPRVERPVAIEKRSLVPRPPASANQATEVELEGVLVRYLSFDSSADPSSYSGRRSLGLMPVRVLRDDYRVDPSQKVPRRAPIRRRGKRGRIWRAGAHEAYENRTQLTNDAQNLLPVPSCEEADDLGDCRSERGPGARGRPKCLLDAIG